MAIEAELFDGTVLEFPDGTSPEIIQSTVRAQTAQRRSASAPAAPSVTPEAAAAAEGRSLPSPSGYSMPPAKAEKTPGRALTLGAQGVGKGIADVVGMAPDLSTGAVNLALAGADKAAGLFGGGVDYRFPPSALGSEAISSTVGGMAEAAGLPLVTPQDLQESLSYNVNRFGTQGLLTGTLLARTGGAMTPSATPRMSDPFIKPYAKAPLKTIAGDTVAGAGSGVGLTASQQLPESVRSMGDGSLGTIADYIAMMAGGVAGGIGAATVADAPSTARSFLTAKRPAQGVDFDPVTGEAVTNRAFDKAAERMQTRASDPSAAIQSIDATMSDFGGLPLPTTGLMSNDTGLINLEQAMRTRQGGSSLAEGANVDPAVKARNSFVERDIALRDAAVGEVNSLRPANADPTAFPQRAGDIVDMRLEQAQRPVDKAAGEIRAVETAQRPIADDLNANIGQGTAASRNIDDVYRTTRQTEQQRSAALYNDPAIARAEVPVQPLADTAQSVAGQGSAVAPLNPTVQKYVDRFRSLGIDAPPTPRTADDFFREFRARAEAEWRTEGGEGPLPQWQIDDARADAQRAAAEALGARQTGRRIDPTANITDPYFGAPESARTSANLNPSPTEIAAAEAKLPPRKVFDAFDKAVTRLDSESGPVDSEAILRAFPESFRPEAEQLLRDGGLREDFFDLFGRAYPETAALRESRTQAVSNSDAIMPEAARRVRPDVNELDRQVVGAANDRAPPSPPAPTTRMADVNRLRAEIEADIKANLDNGAVVQQLRQFKDQTAQYADRLAAEGSPAGAAAAAASENFATRVQPNFREGAGGRVDATLKSNPNSPTVLPSEMAGNFLTRPEDAQALMRIAELGGNREAVAGNARTWLFDQLASRGVAKDGAIDGEKLALWRNRNLELVDQIPGLRQEVDGLVRDARRGEALKGDYATHLAQAERNAGAVKADAEGGILGTVRGKSPEKAAAAVFSSPDPEKAMVDLVATVGKNPAARDGLKAAMAEHISKKVSGVAPQNVSEGTQNVNFAQLTKFFEENRKTLSKLYSPEEMNSLQSAQKVLAPLAKRAQAAGVGSKTAENGADYWRTFEAGAKLYFGMLKGGGITRTARLLASQLDDGSTAAADRLLSRAMFDPKLAKQLLGAKIEKVPAPATNKEVGKILRRGEAARGAVEGEKEDPAQPLELTVKKRPGE